MSALVLFDLLNKLRKSDKMRALRSILSLFLKEFNKFSNTRAQMLGSIYLMSLELLKNYILVLNVKIFPSFTQR